jgi:hypothetical protein
VKTALIIGGAALAIYVVWRFGSAQSAAATTAVSATGAYTPSGPPPGVPFGPPPPPLMFGATPPPSVAVTPGNAGAAFGSATAAALADSQGLNSPIIRGAMPSNPFGGPVVATAGNPWGYAS